MKCYSKFLFFFFSLEKEARVFALFLAHFILWMRLAQGMPVSHKQFTEEEQFYCYLCWVCAVILLNILLPISADSGKRKLESLGIDPHQRAGLATPVVTALLQYPFPFGRQRAPFSAWEVRVLLGHLLRVLLSLPCLTQHFMSLKQMPSLHLPVQSV